MGAPHNKNRYGEKWDEIHTAIMALELSHLQNSLTDDVVISGGWAWCAMTPEHVDYKHAHDLKDIDLFVKPDFLGEFVERIRTLEYVRERTKYDRLSPFYRYTKMVRQGIACGLDYSFPLEDKKIILDVFVQEIPSVVVPQGYRIVEPSTLASFYGMHNPDSLLHGSGQCWSLARYRKLEALGQSPIDNPAMADFSEWLKK